MTDLDNERGCVIYGDVIGNLPLVPRMHIYGSALFKNLPDREFPKLMVVRENLHIMNCKNFERITDDTVVSSWVKITGCPKFKGIFNRGFMKDSLIILDCESFYHLPENLKIAGSLCVAGCPSFKNLPENLVVLGDVSVSNNVAWPQRYNVFGQINFYDR